MQEKREMNLSCRVKDFMHKELITFDAEMDVMEAMRVMVENSVSGGPVVDQHHTIIGIITEKDCQKVVLNASYYNEWGGAVQNYMTREVVTVDDNMTITELAKRFIEGPYRRFPVVNNGRLVGQVSRHDVLRVLLAMAG